MSRTPFYILVSVLMILGVGLSVFRHEMYGIPWLQNNHKAVWELEARVQFQGDGDPAKVSLAIPQSQKGFTLVNETTASPDYGVNMVSDGETGRRVEWTIRKAKGEQVLYYKAQLLMDEHARYNVMPPTDNATITNPFDAAQKTAALTLLAKAKAQSTNNVTLTRQLIQFFNDANNQNAALLLHKYSLEDALIYTLNMENQSARAVGALSLEDGRRRQQIEPMIEVWDGGRWHIFNPKTGQQDKAKNILVWQDAHRALLDVEGGRESQVSFSILANDITPQQALSQKVKADDLLNFSIHSLPVEEQAMFKTILLIPIGALIVVFLRVIVGLKTSGTFMPVLIAVAFVQTELLTGIIGFLLVVSVGLVIRSYLSKLNLLLVSRISAVIISVILIISVFTILAYKMGLLAGLSITFFPMIILSWTIERMSIIWEEDGWQEVIKQGGGSLLTAILVYLAMTNEWVRHLTFNFIGLQLVILAIILLLGNYTGYRLSELRRFKPLVEQK